MCLEWGCAFLPDYLNFYDFQPSYKRALFIILFLETVENV